MSATWFLQFLVWLLNASFLVQSYHIAPSCSHYSGKDLTDMVEEAMEEAFDMKESAEYAIIRDPEEGDYDNSKPELWRQADYDDHQETKRRYGSLDDIEPDLIDIANDDGSDIIIYCGNSDFETDDGLTWVETRTKEGLRYQGNLIDGKWSICPPKTATYTVTWSRRSKPVVFLCDILESLPGFTEPDVRDRSSYGKLYEKDLLSIGAHLYGQVGLVRVVSMSLLHELFHVMHFQDFLGGDDEFFSWHACAASTSSITLVEAMKNPDSFALYAATLCIRELDEDFIFISGVLTSKEEYAERLKQESDEDTDMEDSSQRRAIRGSSRARELSEYDI